MRFKPFEMVTGVETAGLVLAAFPLVVNSLGSYVSGANMLRRWRNERMYGRVNGDAPESYRGQSVDEKSLFCSTMGRCQLSIYTCSRHLSAAICRGCGLHSPFSWWLTAEISN